MCLLNGVWAMTTLLATASKRSLVESVKWYRKAADRGYTEAQFDLGDCYWKGEGVTQDYTEAAKWYRKAADQGYAYAQWRLGIFYDTGTGVTKDAVEAYKWDNLASAQRR